MKIRKIILVILAVITVNGSIEAQGGGNRTKRLIDLLGKTAYSYFLSANRPGFGVDAYLTDKGRVFLSTGFSYSDGSIDIPFGVSYGISKKVEVSAGISPYTQSYSFIGDEINGVGDAYFGLKFKIQESDYFMHALQTMVKIPTASKQTELGTGKFDFHIGLAEGFYYNRFGYDVSVEVNMLRRRDYPTSRKYPVILQNIIESVKADYDYKYEPELVLAAGPSYQIGDKVSVYAGFSFSRNTRLNYNTSVLYGGFGVLLSDNSGFSAGGTYNPGELQTWSISSNFFFSF